MPEKDQGYERIWMISGCALVALFFLKQAGMIFQGALMGFGLYVFMFGLFTYFPKTKKFCFALGGVFDLAVSFGVPLVICTVMGISGGTVAIATMTCGLLWTFTIITSKLGGPVNAIVKSAFELGGMCKQQLLEAKKYGWNSERSEGGGDHRLGGDNHRRYLEQQAQQAKARHEGPGVGGRKLLTLTNYTVK